MGVIHDESLLTVQSTLAKFLYCCKNYTTKQLSFKLISEQDYILPKFSELLEVQGTLTNTYPSSATHPYTHVIVEVTHLCS